MVDTSQVWKSGTIKIHIIRLGPKTKTEQTVAMATSRGRNESELRPLAMPVCASAYKKRSANIAEANSKQHSLRIFSKKAQNQM